MELAAFLQSLVAVVNGSYENVYTQGGFYEEENFIKEMFESLPEAKNVKEPGDESVVKKHTQFFLWALRHDTSDKYDGTDLCQFHATTVEDKIEKEWVSANYFGMTETSEITLEYAKFCNRAFDVREKEEICREMAEEFYNQ